MDISDEEIREFQKTVKTYSAYDLGEYSINSLRRRLLRIIENYDKSIANLNAAIKSSKAEMEITIKRITVTTTELFRDPDIWISLMTEVLPDYLGKESLNIWHAGCSTGQEVYSMMILLDQLNSLDKVNIYASDINSDVLDVAKKGIYQYRFNKPYIENFYTIFNDEIRDRYEIAESFKPHEQYFKTDVAKDIIIMNDYLTNKPEFQNVDLVSDDNPFYINFDLIMCRNVIIYFNYELQKKVISLFHRNMRQGGCLVLGIHESIIGGKSHEFTKNNCFYYKT